MALGRLQVLKGDLSQRARGRTLARLALVLPWLLVGLSAGPAGGHPHWHEDEQRLRTGLAIFPAVIGALQGLEHMASTDGSLALVVVHGDSPEAGRHAATLLARIEPIRGHHLRLITLDASALDTYEGPPIAGVFVSNTGIQGRRLRAWSERLRTLVFSPFAGDVESGAVAGIHVSDQVLPYVNLPQAARAGLSFRPFLLRVARRYE